MGYNRGMTTVICENGHYIAKLRCEPVAGNPIIAEDFYDLADGMEEQMKPGMPILKTHCPVCKASIFTNMKVHTTDGLKP